MSHHPQGCDSCGQKDCHLSFVNRDIKVSKEKTAAIVDEYWPEFDHYLSQVLCQTDQVIFPGVLGKTWPKRYAWSRGQAHGTLATLKRHLDMARVAKARGSIRNATYIRNDEKIARTLARHIDHLSEHLIVSQTLLPYLWRDGYLGGRRFDVLMSRYPLLSLHQHLDHLALKYPLSPTIQDFRAPEALVLAEDAALKAASQLIGPHFDILSAYGARSHVLEWQAPKLRPHIRGERVAFIGAGLVRDGAAEVRALASKLQHPLIIFSQVQESDDFWQGIPVERRIFNANWMDEIGTILHPAPMTTQPRRLLQAHAQGIKIYATAGCGLKEGQYEDWERFLTLKSGL